MTRKVHQRINHYHNPYSTENTMRRREHLPKHDESNKIAPNKSSSEIDQDWQSVMGRKRERERERILIRRCRESVKYPLTRQQKTEEPSAIQRRFDGDLHDRSVSTRSRGNGAEAKDEKLGLVDGSFQPRSIQLLSGVLSQPGYARVSRYQIYFLDEESSSLPGSSIRGRKGCSIFLVDAHF